MVNHSFLQVLFFSSKATSDCNVLSRTVSYWLDRARATHLVRPTCAGWFRVDEKNWGADRAV